MYVPSSIILPTSFFPMLPHGSGGYMIILLLFGFRNLWLVDHLASPLFFVFFPLFTPCIVEMSYWLSLLFMSVLLFPRAWVWRNSLLPCPQHTCQQWRPLADDVHHLLSNLWLSIFTGYSFDHWFSPFLWRAGDPYAGVWWVWVLSFWLESCRFLLSDFPSFIISFFIIATLLEFLCSHTPLPCLAICTLGEGRRYIGRWINHRCRLNYQRCSVFRSIHVFSLHAHVCSTGTICSWMDGKPILTYPYVPLRHSFIGVFHPVSPYFCCQLTHFPV